MRHDSTFSAGPSLLPETVQTQIEEFKIVQEYPCFTSSYRSYSNPSKGPTGFVQHVSWERCERHLLRHSRDLV